MAANATGAPLPGLNLTGISTEGITTVVTVVDRFLTYCPEPTVFVWAGRTYSVDAPATVTISDCPSGCTIATDCYYKGPTLVPQADSNGAYVIKNGSIGDGEGPPNARVAAAPTGAGVVGSGQTSQAASVFVSGAPSAPAGFRAKVAAMAVGVLVALGGVSVVG
ncbi:hypothetical protein OQA88_12772 [Cercophora sp. LCS_1]